MKRLLQFTGVIIALALVLVACVEPPKPRDPGTPAGTPLPKVNPPGGAPLTAVPVITDHFFPTAADFASNGRVWIAEKAGKVFTYDSVDDPTPTLTVDITAAVRNWGDHGILGMAIDPQFPTRPYLYVQHAVDSTGKWNDGCPSPPGASVDGCETGARLVRITLDNAGVATGEQLVLASNKWCYQFASHAIGDLVFLPDGTLLSSSGEGSNWSDTDYGQFGGTWGFEPNRTPANPCDDPPGGEGVKGTPPTSEGGAFRSQDLLTTEDPLGWNGSVVRLNPDTGAAPNNNPLKGGATTADDHHLAFGFRNPFRMTVDPTSGDLFVADVGWTAYEEINRLNPLEGQVRNFGWPCKEGQYDQAAYSALRMTMCTRAASSPYQLTNPWVSFWHDRAGLSVSALDFIEPGTYPPEFDNTLMFGDYVTNKLYTLKPEANGTADPKKVKVAADGVVPADLMQAPDGYVYIVDVAEGSLKRLMDSSLVPEAVINPSATEGPLPLSVTLDGTDSVDPTGNGLTYDWDLNGDGTYGDSSSPAPVLNLTTATNVTVGLKVTTTAGTSDTATVTLYPGNSAPTIDLDVTSPLPWKAGDIIEFNLTANDPDGPLPAGAVEWFTELEHCYSLEDCHNHPVEEGTSLSGSLEGPSHEYPSFLRVTASVTDSRGQKTTISQQLQPESSNLTVNGQPTNLAVVIGSDTYQTPETVEMITGSNITVSAVTPQVIGGVSHVFGFWSDGGTASHSVVVDNDKTIKLTMLFG